MTGFVGPNANHITLTPGSSGTGSGTGFMGFGPTGFTTPIDTVLDRFGRTGTIFLQQSHRHITLQTWVIIHSLILLF